MNASMIMVKICLAILTCYWFLPAGLNVPTKGLFLPA